jgi:S-disulfanyl-L-cysteine oxidoreductase SoxD
MPCSSKLLVPALILIAPLALAAVAQASERLYPEVGMPLTQKEIQSFDRIVGPEGKELPPGSGTAKQGAVIFAQRCQLCHGENGQNGIVRKLVIGKPGQPYRGDFYGDERNGPSFYPYPTIAWDYINRAMPASNPGSLKPDEVYALVAYLYYENGIIKEDEVMNAQTLPEVQMPNRNGFVPAKPVYPPEKKPSWW